jgi:hypothetical protein
MKQINVRNAAEAERFGALAVRGKSASSKVAGAASLFTEGQKRALADLARSLIHVAKKCGAEEKTLNINGLSFDLRESDGQEILFVRSESR